MSKSKQISVSPAIDSVAKVTEKEAESNPFMTRFQIVKNLIIASLGMCFLGCSFLSLTSLQTTINHTGNVGSLCYSALYVAYILACLLLPKFLVSVWGYKLTLVISMLCFIPYMAANYSTTITALLPTSILLGVGNAVLWSVLCTYLQKIGIMYSYYGANSFDVVTSLFFGILLMFYQNGHIWGNLLAHYVLRRQENKIYEAESFIDNLTEVLDENLVSNSTSLCGANFCGETNFNLLPPSDDDRFVLISVLIGLALLSVFIVATFLDRLKKEEDGNDDSSVISRLVATIKHWKKPNQLLLVPLTIFIGLQYSFLFSDYTQVQNMGKGEQIPVSPAIDSVANVTEEKGESKPHMTRFRIVKNLLIISFGVCCLSSSHLSLMGLQTTMNHSGNVGSLCYSALYVAYILASLLLPKFLVSLWGYKLTLVISMMCFIPYMAANYSTSITVLLPTSVLLGLGYAVLWCVLCTYVQEIGILYSYYGKDSFDVTTSIFFGILLMFNQLGHILGNLLAYYVLSRQENEIYGAEYVIDNVTEVLDKNVVSNSTSLCGTHFCGETNFNLLPPSDDDRFILISLLIGLSLLSVFIVATFLDPLRKEEDENDDSSIISRLVATIKHWKKPNQLLLVPLTIFIAFQYAFLFSDYTQGYIACAWGIHNVGLVLSFFGVSNAITSPLIGRIAKYVPRVVLIYLGAISSLSVFTFLLFWNPAPKGIIYFIIVGIWGFSDAIWETTIATMYGMLFRSDEEAAFANIRLWEGIGYFTLYICNNYMCMSSKLYLLLSMLIVGMLAYTIMEINIALQNKSFNLNKKIKC